MKFNNRTEDMTGWKFGRLTVKGYDGLWLAGKPSSGSAWLCDCDCGKAGVRVRASFLRKGGTRSCGCLRVELLRAGRTHGLSRSEHEMYVIWQGIKTRCYNKRHSSYRNYGARGVKMCAAWKRSFPVFLEAVGPRPSRAHSIDRFPDYGGDYEPGNVRWATGSEQASNTRRTRIFEWGGELLSLTTICRREGVQYSAVYNRVIGKREKLEDAIAAVKAMGFPFLERAAEFGGGPEMRLTERKRKRMSAPSPGEDSVLSADGGCCEAALAG
jgi:hypothetical protein